MVHTFLKGVSPKVNIIEFELAYYDVTVQCFNPYTTGNPLKKIRIYLFTIDFLII